MLRVGDGAAAVCALLVPKLHQSGVWKLQPLLGCAGRNAEDSVSVLGLRSTRGTLSFPPSFLPSEAHVRRAKKGARGACREGMRCGVL